MHRHWPRYIAALVAALVFPTFALGQTDAPNASFSFAPESPRVGDEVTFTSSSCDPGSRLSGQAWDLDGDGAYDDAAGPVAEIRFSAPGAHTVGLQVTDRDDMADVQRRTITVDTQYALPRPDSARLLSPFPVVTLAGRLTPAGARIRRLSVRAPVCARVLVRCQGGNCRARRFSAFAGRRALRIRRFERQLRAGAVLTIAVSKGNRIGKLTTFRIRKGRAPLRRDRCLRPGEQEGSRCPRD